MKVISHLSANEKVIALTFDDGPNEPYTSQILDILKKFNIKATFFPVGENIIRNKNILKKIFANGHIIGNHSYSHSMLAPILSPSYKNEIIKTQELIFNIIGQKPIFFRPPWLFRTKAMLKTAENNNLQIVTGTFGSYFEVLGTSPEKIARNTLRKIKPSMILIFHDGYNNKIANRKNTVEAIKIIIPSLIEKGYKFTLPK